MNLHAMCHHPVMWMLILLSDKCWIYFKILHVCCSVLKILHAMCFTILLFPQIIWLPSCLVVSLCVCKLNWRHLKLNVINQPGASYILINTDSVLNSLVIRNMNSCLDIHFIFTFLEFYTILICHTCGGIKDACVSK
jgi:hypothetical protein